MIVHQCDSCQTLSQSSNDLPAGWARVVLTLPGEHSPRIYDLCAECLSKPMTFGNIALNRGK